MGRRKSEEYSSPISKTINFLKADKTRVIIVGILLLLSFISLIGFTSYMFTWTEDQFFMELGFIKYIFDGNVVVYNWGSKLGASLAYIFIHNLFGVPSFLFIAYLVLIACKIIGYEPVPFRRFMTVSAAWLIWSSVFLGFVFGDKWFCLGGVFGYEVSYWLYTVIGNFGTFIFLLIGAASIVFFTVEHSFDWVKIFIEDFMRHRSLKTAYDSANTFAMKLSEIGSANNNETSSTRKYSSRKNSSASSDDDDYKVDFGDDDDPQDNPNSLNSPVNTPDGEKKPSKVGSFFKDIFTGKDYVGRDQKLVFDEDPAPKKPVSPFDRKPADAPKQEVVKEQFVIGGEPEKPAQGDTLDFQVEDLRDNEERIDIPAPDPDVQPVEVQPGQDQSIPQPQGDDLSMMVETNHDVKVDVSTLPPYDPTLELSSYKLPPVSLLRQGGEKQSVTQTELTENKTRIVNVLKDFKIKVTRITAKIGPTVTLYEITPAPGIKVAKIKNLEDDIMLALAATGIRIIAPLPGRGTVGIEVPNKNPEIVTMESLITTVKFQNSTYELPLALGKTISNEAYVIDLVKCPHLLVAGATGQGKSVGLNAIIASLLYKKHPATVKFVLVDPKKVELSLYNNIEKHYLAKLPTSDEAIITDVDRVKETLNSLTVEMTNRYELLKEAQVRTIKEYNAKFISRRLNPENGHKFLPYIVVVVDEFADLIMTAGKEVEKPLARLAQLARAIGIHLIVATQRPDVKVITGTIKANFPVRIAFRVMSVVDSRTILDQGGADNLIGRGDMLINTGAEITRLQCAFIDTPELEDITRFIGEQKGYPTTYELPEPDIDAVEPGEEVDLKKRDSLFEEAARIIVMSQQGSTSMLQRRLEIGYNRAGRIMDQLEAAGIVGPNEGSKARSVNIDSEYALEQFIQNLDRSL